MTAKRKRGRPRKPGLLSGMQTHPFRPLPDGEISAKDVAKLTNWYRNYLADKPHIVDSNGDFQKWLSATADAIESGDAVRVGYYALNAMFQRALLCYQEPVNIDPPETAPGALSPDQAAEVVRAKHRAGQRITLFDLADVGRAALLADKKRGRRADW